MIAFAVLLPQITNQYSMLFIAHREDGVHNTHRCYPDLFEGVANGYFPSSPRRVFILVGMRSSRRIEDALGLPASYINTRTATIVAPG